MERYPSSGEYRFTFLIKNSPTLQVIHKALGVVLLSGPKGALFLMGKVPL